MPRTNSKIKQELTYGVYEGHPEVFPEVLSCFESLVKLINHNKQINQEELEEWQKDFEYLAFWLDQRFSTSNFSKAHYILYAFNLYVTKLANGKFDQADFVTIQTLVRGLREIFSGASYVHFIDAVKYQNDDQPYAEDFRTLIKLTNHNFKRKFKQDITEFNDNEIDEFETTHFCDLVSEYENNIFVVQAWDAAPQTLTSHVETQNASCGSQNSQMSHIHGTFSSLNELEEKVKGCSVEQSTSSQSYSSHNSIRSKKSENNQRGQLSHQQAISSHQKVTLEKFLLAIGCIAAFALTFGMFIPVAILTKNILTDIEKEPKKGKHSSCFFSESNTHYTRNEIQNIYFGIR